MSENTEKLVDVLKREASSKIRENPHYKKCVERLKNDCPSKHEVRYSGYGNSNDDYILTYMLAVGMRNALVEEGLRVTIHKGKEVKEFCPNYAGERGDRNGAFEIVVSGWVD